MQLRQRYGDVIRQKKVRGKSKTIININDMDSEFDDQYRDLYKKYLS